MNKIIGITIRQEEKKDYNEIRDQIDIRFYDLFEECGFLPILIPNNVNVVEEYLKRIEFDGFVLSGGGTPYPYTQNETERDCIERMLIDYSIHNKLSVLGICRGMQALALYFGANLINVNDHVNTKHLVRSTDGQIYQKNSYHNWAVESGNELLNVDMIADDGNIEAISVNGMHGYGIMWHPERERIFLDEDVVLFKKIFESNIE